MTFNDWFVLVSVCACVRLLCVFCASSVRRVCVRVCVRVCACVRLVCVGFCPRMVARYIYPHSLRV